MKINQTNLNERTSRNWQCVGCSKNGKFQIRSHNIKVPCEYTVRIVVFYDKFVCLTRFQVDRLINVMSIVCGRANTLIIAQ